MAQILIFGVHDKKTRVAGGVEFVQPCPNCGGSHLFREMASRRYFSLFFIPLVPIGKGSSLIACTNCKAAFHFDAKAYQRAKNRPKPQQPARPDIAPAVAETIVIHCVHCGEKLGVPFSSQPESHTCPHCRKSFEVRL